MTERVSFYGQDRDLTNVDGTCEMENEVVGVNKAQTLAQWATLQSSANATSIVALHFIHHYCTQAEQA